MEKRTRSQQGVLGELRAIYELSKLGYAVSTPVQIHIPYDLVIDDGHTLQRVQVKTSSRKAARVGDTAAYVVNLASSGGNTRGHTKKRFDPNQVDWVFVEVTDGRCWLIPSSEILSGLEITVGTAKYEQHQLP
jgi:hypothetical protein